MDINQEVLNAIERQLPSAVGDVLRARLEQADNDKKLLEQATAKIARMTGDAADLQRQVAQQAAELEKHGKLAEREAKVLERERTQDLADLKVKLEAEQRFGQQVATALQGLVRNVEYRNNWGGNQGFAAPNPNGSYGMQTAVVPVGGSSSTTTA